MAKTEVPETTQEAKKRLMEESKFRQAMIGKLTADEKRQRTAKDTRFKENAQLIKDSTVMQSSNKLTNKITGDLLKLSEDANSLSIKELDIQKKHLKNLEASLAGITDPVEKNKLQDLIEISRQNLKQSTSIGTKVADIVSKSLVNSTAILAGVFAESPLLGIGIKLAGDAVVDKLKDRQERKTALANQTESFKESLQELEESDRANNEEMIERMNESNTSEEDKRENAVLEAEKAMMLERVAEGIENLSMGDKKEEGGIGLGGALALGGASIGLALMTAIKGAMLTFGAGLKVFVMKSLPKLLLKLSPVGLILGLVFGGIKDGFKAFSETGQISNAIIAGMAGVLDFITFGLIDKEAVKGFLNPIFDSIKEALFSPIETLNKLVTVVADFFDGINTDIMETLDINPKEIFQETLQTVIDSIVSFMMYLADLPLMIINSVKDIGGDLANKAGDFFADLNPFANTQEPILAGGPAIELEPIETTRKEEVIKTLIVEKKERDVKSNIQASEDGSKGFDGGAIAVNAPVTNNQVSNRTVYNNLSSANPRRIITD